jgi:hypothetical protein
MKVMVLNTLWMTLTRLWPLSFFAMFILLLWVWHNGYLQNIFLEFSLQFHREITCLQQSWILPVLSSLVPYSRCQQIHNEGDFLMLCECSHKIKITLLFCVWFRPYLDQYNHFSQLLLCSGTFVMFTHPLSCMYYAKKVLRIYWSYHNEHVVLWNSHLDLSSTRILFQLIWWHVKPSYIESLYDILIVLQTVTASRIWSVVHGLVAKWLMSGLQ